jgi:hypothetical protein
VCVCACVTHVTVDALMKENVLGALTVLAKDQSSKTKEQVWCSLSLVGFLCIIISSSAALCVAD